MDFDKLTLLPAASDFDFDWSIRQFDWSKFDGVNLSKTYA